MVANRARARAITIPNAPAPPADAAERRRIRHHRIQYPRIRHHKIHTHLNTAVQQNAIKNTTSNRNLARSANTADQNTDRPQRAGAGVAEWG